jgi:hypothetical protein
VRSANGGARLPKGRMAFAKGLALPSDFNDARPRHSPSRALGMPGPGSTNAAKPLHRRDEYPRCWRALGPAQQRIGVGLSVPRKPQFLRGRQSNIPEPRPTISLPS